MSLLHWTTSAPGHEPWFVSAWSRQQFCAVGLQPVAGGRGNPDILAGYFFDSSGRPFPSRLLVAATSKGIVIAQEVQRDWGVSLTNAINTCRHFLPVMSSHLLLASNPTRHICEYYLDADDQSLIRVSTMDPRFTPERAPLTDFLGGQPDWMAGLASFAIAPPPALASRAAALADARHAMTAFRSAPDAEVDTALTI